MSLLVVLAGRDNEQRERWGWYHEKGVNLMVLGGQGWPLNQLRSRTVGWVEIACDRKETKQWSSKG